MWTQYKRVTIKEKHINYSGLKYFRYRMKNTYPRYPMITFQLLYCLNTENETVSILLMTFSSFMNPYIILRHFRFLHSSPQSFSAIIYDFSHRTSTKGEHFLTKIAKQKEYRQVDHQSRISMDEASESFHKKNQYVVAITKLSSI